MRTISENKMRSAPRSACLGQHRLYVGIDCPSCGAGIPFGPYTPSAFNDLFGGAVNEPLAREPRPEHVAAQQAYLFAVRERERAYGEAQRLEAELERAHQTTHESNWNGSTRITAPDESKVEKLSAELATAREARAAADADTEKALRAFNRTRA